MCRKSILARSIVLFVSAMLSVPAFAGVTATFSSISNSWPAIAGTSLQYANYTDPNSPTGGSGSGPDERVGENFNDRALMQTFRVPPADSTHYGFTLTNIVITGSGGGNTALPPCSLHLYDLNQAPDNNVGDDDTVYNLAYWDSIPNRYAYFSPAANFAYPRDETINAPDKFIQFDFNEFDKVDLEPNHLYAFEIWPTPGTDPGWFWLRDVVNHTGGRAYHVPPGSNGPDEGSGPSDLSTDRGQITASSRDLVLGVYGLPYDGNAFHPMPQNYAQDVAVSTSLTWTPGKDANTTQGHQLWFSTIASNVARRMNSANMGRLDSPAWTPPSPLNPATTYYWRVDEYGPGAPTHPDGNAYWGANSGFYTAAQYAQYVWRFTTTGLKAHNPQPANGATDVQREPTLTWAPGGYAAEHDVYFGASFAEVNDATTSTPLIYKGSQNPNNYTPAGLLAFDKTYYWRIDEVNDGIPGSPWKGDVWGFKTRDVRYLSADVDRNYYVDFNDFTYIGRYWLENCGVPDECEGADIYPAGGDGTVDYGDLDKFVSQWLAQDPLCISSIGPRVIPTNTPVTITIVTIMIDPGLIPQEITLWRGNDILGTFHDDGSEGDPIAGDRFFTIQRLFLESSPTTITLQMSVRFAGIPGELFSQTYLLDVVDEPIICPETATATLDANGIFILPDIRQAVILNQGIFSQNANITQDPAPGTVYSFPQTVMLDFTAIDPCTMFEAACSTPISIEDHLAPKIIVGGVEPGAAYAISDCVTPTVQVSDNFDPNEAITVEAILNGSVYTPGTPICNAGRYSLGIAATDTSGNVTEYPKLIFSVVDTNKMKAAAMVVKEFAFTPGSLNTTLLVASDQFDVFEIDGYSVSLHLFDSNGMFLDYKSIPVAGVFDSNGYTPQDANAYFHHGFWELTFDVNDPLLEECPGYLLLSGSAFDGTVDWIGHELLPGPESILPIVSMTPLNTPLTSNIPDPNAEDMLVSKDLTDINDVREQVGFTVVAHCCPKGKWKVIEKIGGKDETRRSASGLTWSTWMWAWAEGGYIWGTAWAKDVWYSPLFIGVADDAASAISTRSIKVWLEGCDPKAECCGCEITLEATPSFKAYVNLDPPGLAIAGGKIEVKGDLSAVAEGAVVSGTKTEQVSLDIAKVGGVSVPAVSKPEGKKEQIFSGNDSKILEKCNAILTVTGSTYLKVMADADLIHVNFHAEAFADIWKSKLGISIDAKCKNPVPDCGPDPLHFELE